MADTEQAGTAGNFVSIWKTCGCEVRSCLSCIFKYGVHCIGMDQRTSTPTDRLVRGRAAPVGQVS